MDEKIFVNDDAWKKSFSFLGHFALGHVIAIISDDFDRLVDTHFVAKKWSLGSLKILRATGSDSAEIAKLDVPNGTEVERNLPIPIRPPPANVIGFRHLQISFINKSVVEFLQRIRPLFDSSGTNVYIECYGDDQKRVWKIIWQRLWPLVTCNIRALRVSGIQLGRLRQFSPTILLDCAKLQSVYSLAHFPEFPPNDNANSSPGQAVANWLVTPRMDKLKQDFSEASKPANFIIRVQAASNAVIETFEPVKNDKSGEQLTLRRRKNKWLLVRSPIERNQEQWAKWEEEAFEWEGHNQWNRIGISFSEDAIGVGMGAKRCLIS
uniref:Uncharacterized protein n=1 Tax=Globodera rostochiensis TaxID=31243 RepID=A0A914H405_GLORO